MAWAWQQRKVTSNNEEQMQRFRHKPIEVEAVQITAATFDSPHPNPEHVEGVEYDPLARTVIALESFSIGGAGDWIVCLPTGSAVILPADKFAETYELVEG